MEDTEYFFGLESFRAFSSRKEVPTTTSISARTWCPRPLWAPNFTHGYWLCALTSKNHHWLKKNSIFNFFNFFCFFNFFLKHFMFGKPSDIASAPKVWLRAYRTWNALRVFLFWVKIDWFHLEKCNFVEVARFKGIESLTQFSCLKTTHKALLVPIYFFSICECWKLSSWS
jgi:hypothetical protein